MARPLPANLAIEWAEDQIDARARLGLPFDPDVGIVLTNWVSLGQVEWEVIGEHQPLVEAERGNVEIEAARPISVAVCTSCGEVYSESVPFCSQCGSPTDTPEPTVASLLESVQRLEREMADLGGLLRRIEHGSGDRYESADFDWLAVPPAEKWSVTWGVFGRTILINIAVFLGLMILMMAVAGIGCLAE